MARASTRTLLPLDRFCRLVGYSPLLFSQVYVRDLQPASSCSDPVLQYTWQPQGGGRPGRDEIAEAIKQAEDMLTSYLHFSVLPRWYIDDSVTLATKGAPLRIQARVPNGYFIQGGQESFTEIESGAGITYTDLDGDGYKERATVQVQTTVTDPSEISVYYPNTNHDPAWEVRPIRVSIELANGDVVIGEPNPITQGYSSSLSSDLNTATITFERHQVVKSELLESLDSSGVDGLIDNNFLDSVAIYRHYNNPAQMATVEAPGLCDTSPGQVSAYPGVLTPVDSRSGVVSYQPADWDADDGTYIYTCAYPFNPTRLRLWYRAGFRDLSVARPMHDMSPQFERAITYLALSYIDRGWQSCEQLRNLQAHWRADMAQRESNQSKSSSFQVSRQLLDNPFGTTRAAVYAWRVVQTQMVGQAVLG